MKRERWSGLRVLLLAGCLPVWSGRALAETPSVVCSEGSGRFETLFGGTVNVQVGPSSAGELSSRSCSAIVAANRHRVEVATDSSIVDLDALGVDLGLGSLVAAFQVKKTPADCCMEYDIYSISGTPQLLRRITGGDFYRAEDTDLDGRVEIWMGDVRATEGLEELTAADFEAPPTMVLRFQHGELFDVGSEFRDHFDDQIARLRSTLDASELRAFHDGDKGSRRAVKAAVIGIVWAYLYSGRENEAWGALVEMWPSADREPIRSAIIAARSRGVGAQVKGVSGKAGTGREKHPIIFEATTGMAGRKPEVRPPEPILMGRPSPGEGDQALPQAETNLELVVDSAGKVRAVDATKQVERMDPGLVSAARKWKFVPANKDGRPVPSRMRLAVSLRR